MEYFLNKMETKYKYKIKFEDIMFWIIMAGLFGLALWMLSGSPTEVGAIIGIMGFVGASEIMLWKYLFKINNKSSLKLSKLDNKTQISFIKLRNNMNNRFDNIDKKLNNMDKKFNIIENKLDGKRK